jgi:hypothetical protein
MYISPQNLTRLQLWKIVFGKRKEKAALIMSIRQVCMSDIAINKTTLAK